MAGSLSSGTNALLLTSAIAVVAIGMGCTSDSEPLPSADPDNPLPDCPDTPNCERISRVYPVPANQLYGAAQDALEELGPAKLELRPDSMRATAVYRVAWIFKDDVTVAVDDHTDGSVLHVRSASRVGQDDLGVNKRRVQRLLDFINDTPSVPPSGRK